MKDVETKMELSPAQREELLGLLQARFEKNMNRHKGVAWAKVKAKLEANAGKLCACLNLNAVYKNFQAIGFAIEVIAITCG